jgi:hypothetical protein
VLSDLLKLNVLVSMQRVYNYVLESVFGVYLSDPAALSLRLAEVKTAVRMTEAGLEFTLPELYQFATLEVIGNGDQSYTSFRRCLYGQQTQVTLRQLGGEVVIAQNYDQVDRSIYRLQALN